MALMTWNDSISTGVRAMDEQHKGLVNTLNELHAAMLAGQNGAATGKLLINLVKYTHDHFNAEEALMTRAKYPKLTGHCLKHKDLTGQVEKFVQRYERGEISLNVDLLMFLRDWLANHIQKEDRDYGPWLNQNGIRSSRGSREGGTGSQASGLRFRSWLSKEPRVPKVRVELID